MKGSTTFTGWSRKRARTETGPRGCGETGWGEKKKTRRGLSTWADNQSVPLTRFTFNNNIHEKIRRIIVWLTYKTCAKIVKQFRKYMWSKCDLWTNEAQGNGAKVRRRNRGGIGQAASSQFCALSNENVARKFWANQKVHPCKTNLCCVAMVKWPTNLNQNAWSHLFPQNTSSLDLPGLGTQTRHWTATIRCRRS